MSLQYSDTSTKRGIIQGIERWLFGETGYGKISSNATLLQSFNAEINLALDEFWSVAIPASGIWQLDDTNHTDWPEITATLTSGTRRYAFTADSGANLMLDIFRVYVKNPSGIYQELAPIDVQSADNTESFTDGQSLSGIPTRFDKTGKWIDLDPIPNYTIANGIKCLVNREGSYFLTSDTTKKPGVAGIYHEFFVLRPVYWYAVRNNLPIADRVGQLLFAMRRDIGEYYSRRERTVPRRMIPLSQDTR